MKEFSPPPFRFPIIILTISFLDSVLLITLNTCKYFMKTQTKL